MKTPQVPPLPGMTPLGLPETKGHESAFLNEDDGATLYCDNCNQQIRTNEAHTCPEAVQITKHGHTAGPLYKTISSTKNADIYDPHHRWIASFLGDHRGKDGAPRPSFPSNLEAVNNANLFLSSHYLLTACETALALFSDPNAEAPEANQVVVMLENAIAKSKGGE